MPELLPEHLVNSSITCNLPKEDSMFTLPGLVHMRQFELIDVDDFAYSINYYLRKNNKSNIYFSDYPETFEPRYINLINATACKLLDKYKIPRKNIKYICGAWPVPENIALYKQHCIENNWIELPLYLINYFEYNMTEHLLRNKPVIEGIDKIKKSKIFLCLNGGPRPHRIYVLAYFFKHKLLDKSYFSMHGNFNHINFVLNNLNIKFNWYKDFKRLLQDFLKNKPKMPMILSLDPSDFQGQHVISKEDVKLFADSYISIINETSFFKKDFLIEGDIFNSHLDSIFLTEKTFRAIACQHPFIMVSRPHTLKHLRRLGYKTFNSLIDESYDDIEDDHLRLQKICELCKDLANRNEEFWEIFQNQVRSITLYNYNHLLSRKHYFISNDNYST